MKRSVVGYTARQTPCDVRWLSTRPLNIVDLPLPSIRSLISWEGTLATSRDVAKRVAPGTSQIAEGGVGGHFSLQAGRVARPTLCVSRPLPVPATDAATATPTPVREIGSRIESVPD